MPRKKVILLTAFVSLAVAAATLAIVYWMADGERTEQIHFERDETELVIANTTGADLVLYRAGENLSGELPVSEFDGDRIWLTKGNYFLRAASDEGVAFYPVPIQGYRSGTDGDDTFEVTVRTVPNGPPWVFPGNSFVYIPNGFFLFGDRLNPNEPHLVWTQGYFIGKFEVSNAEFRQFLQAPDGYANDSNWTEAGKEWRSRSVSASSAKLTYEDPEFVRFGREDLPVTQVTWFEAAAFCKWLTTRSGGGSWQFALPTEAEWEKAARGPDNFDFPASQKLSDKESSYYNWKKNPLAEVTVVGSAESSEKFPANRYGIFHMGGNVVEWTQGLYTPFNRKKPYAFEDGRNDEEASGVRVVRGGSWYSASIALLYIPYRDTFQPEVRHNDLGFRIVARSLMR